MMIMACVIDASHYHAIADEIGTGDRDGDGYADANEGGDDCDDLDPSLHPSAEETWENGVTDNDCDGEREAVELEFGADALIGESVGADAGRRLGVVDDIDGDGRVEVLVGAWTDASLYEQGGAAYLVTGQREGLLSELPAIRPSGASWYLSCALDGGPDLDGDGVPDILVGALGFDEFSGAAWLVSGAELGAGSLTMPQDAIGSVLGTHQGDVASGAARFMGDLDGDGVAELGVSAQVVSTAAYTNAGMVGLFPLDSLGDVVMEDAPIALYGTYNYAYLGGQIANAGDQDGDGQDDYLVTADIGLLAVILPGGDPAPDLINDAIFRLTAASDDVGESAEVRVIGDLDGDGTADLAVVPQAENGVRVSPSVLLYTALKASPVLTTEAPWAVVEIGGDSYLYDVVDAGDLDGDGRHETLVPATKYEPANTAMLAIYFGADIGFNDRVDFLDTPLLGISVRPAAGYGYRTLVTSDLDGDGAGDIVLGGGADDEGGENAGAIAFVPLPR